jgi:hypothetical protein
MSNSTTLNYYNKILASHEARLFEQVRVTVEVLRAHRGGGRQGKVFAIYFKYY